MYFYQNQTPLTLYASVLQNGQTHSNNSSPNCQRIVCVFDHFVGLALKGLTSVEDCGFNEIFLNNFTE